MIKMVLTNYIFILICVFTYFTPGNSQSTFKITIPLNKTITYENKQLYGEFIYINQTSSIHVTFDVDTVNPEVSFIIFQVHSHIYNITAYNKTKNYMSTQTGTNLGFYSQVLKLDTIVIENANNIGLKLYLAVFGYGVEDPVPGKCNMEFPQPIPPYVRVTTTNDYILADVAAPAISGEDNCTTTFSVPVTFYMMYLPERDFNEDSYFAGLQKMMTLDLIMENGIKIPMTNSYKQMRRMMSAYRGTGVVYVAVVQDTNFERIPSPQRPYAVYSPGYSYACWPLVDRCQIIDDLLSRFISVLLLFGGVFICFFGHRFFKTELFFVGLISGVVITYILISLIAELDTSALILASLLSGSFFGAVWSLFWWFYGIPVVSVLLPAMNIGFLTAAIFYYRLPGGITLIQDEMGFWTLFVLLMLIVSVLLVSLTFVCNILSCAVLGAYAVVYPLDFYFGSNLRYIIINVVRRAVVPNFNKTVLEPPFEWKDAVVTVLWITLAISGFLFQHYQNRGRPPFPPPPRSISPVMPDMVDRRPRAGAQDPEERWFRRYLRGGARVDRQPTERSPLLL